MSDQYLLALVYLYLQLWELFVFSWLCHVASCLWVVVLVDPSSSPSGILALVLQSEAQLFSTYCVSGTVPDTCYMSDIERGTVNIFSHSIC